MRFSWRGDLQAALFWQSKGKQELDRLRMRMRSQGLTQGYYQFDLSPTAQAIIRIWPNFESLHIIAQPLVAGTLPPWVYFEFGASGWPLATWEGVVAETSFTAYNGCVIGARLSAYAGQIAISSAVNTGERKHHLSEASKVGRLFQAQLQDEPVAYKRPGTSSGGKDASWPEMVYTTFSPINPYTGIYTASVNYERPTNTYNEVGSERTFSTRDAGFDVPFETGRLQEPVTLAVLRGDSDWPRASGVQTVSARKFAVYIDAFCVVHVFPVLSIEPWDPTFEQNIAADLVRSTPIPMPGWAFVPPAKAMDQEVNDWFANSPDVGWQLNHLGTKAVTVLHEREAVQWDDDYLHDPDTKFDFLHKSWDKASYVGATGTQQLFHGGDTNASVTELYTFGRGVFEVGIRIDITGSDPGDFTVALTTHEVRTPRGSDRGTFMAGYAWQDIKTAAIEAGDMLLLDIERWYEASASTGDPLDGNWGLVVIGAVKGPGGFFAETVSTSVVTPWQLGPGNLYNWLQSHIGFYDPLVHDPEPLYFPGGGAAGGYDSRPALTYVTGRGASFFSLRKRRGGVESEVVAIYGDAVLAVDLKTASFAIGIESETRTDRSVPVSTNYIFDASGTYPVSTSWPTALDMPHLISHPGVAIYTQAALREVLTPDGADQTVITDLNDKAQINPRASLVGWTYMAANDLGDWSSYPDLRDVQMLMNHFTTDWPARLPPDPVSILGVAERNWWLAGMCVSSSNPLLLFISNPNFGWAAYTSEVLRRTRNASTTFFVHPNGSWAYYDANRIYNTYGVPDIFQVWDADNKRRSSGRARYVGTYPYATDGAVLLSINEEAQIHGEHTIFGGDVSLSESPCITQLRKFVLDGAGPVPTKRNDTSTVDGGLGLVVTVPTIINIWNDYNTLSPALGQAAMFKHQIFDRIHFEITRGGNTSTADTTFVEQYNAAVIRLLATNPDADLQPITAEQQRAHISLDVESNTGMILVVEWPSGHEFRLTDRAFKDYVANRDGVLHGQQNSGSLLKPFLTGIFDGGVRVETMPHTFSTCLLLDL